MRCVPLPPGAGDRNSVDLEAFAAARGLPLLRDDHDEPVELEPVGDGSPAGFRLAPA